MTRLSDTDLEALRIGIREQARDELHREYIERNLARAHARKRLDTVELRQARGLLVGDRLAGTDDGYSFHEVAVVTAVGPHPSPAREGKLWVQYDCSEGGRGGRQLDPSEPVLLGRR